MTAYYNEFDKKAAAWLRQLIADGHIPPGDVDERSITDVDPTELAGYRQLHFFAGIGGWPLAARLAGWPDDRELVTGSCPCQPFSVAGKGAGTTDARHLWPDFFRIIRARRPAVVMGEQVAAAVGKGWFVGVRSDLEGIGYDCRGVVIPACAVNAPHRRDRLWFAAGSRVLGDMYNAGSQGHTGDELEGAGWARPDGSVAATGRGNSGRLLEHAESIGRGEGRPESGVWSGRAAASGAGVPDCDLGDLPSERGHGGQGSTGPYGRPGAQTGGAAGCGDVAQPNATQRRPDMARGNDIGGSQARRDEGSGDIAERGFGDVADGNSDGRPTGSGDHSPARYGNPVAAASGARHWHGARWLIGHDGKARRVEPAIPLLVDGLPHRVGLLRGFGNAIAPQIAAEMMAAWMEEFPA